MLNTRLGALTSGDRQRIVCSRAERQRQQVSYHTKEGLLCGIGLLTLAAVGYGMSHTHGLFLGLPCTRRCSRPVFGVLSSFTQMMLFPEAPNQSLEPTAGRRDDQI